MKQNKLNESDLNAVLQVWLRSHEFYSKTVWTDSTDTQYPQIYTLSEELLVQHMAALQGVEENTHNTEKEARVRGMLAQASGVGISFNPYEENSEEFYEWQRGWSMNNM